MSSTLRTLLIVLGGVIGIAWVAVRAQQPTPAQALPSSTSRPSHTPRTLSAAVRARGLSYDPSVVPGDRAVVEQAIADAQPEAQRLIGLVDGLITIDVRPLSGGVVGLTAPRGDAFRVSLNLGEAQRIAGRRGMDRLVLHEIGHVVDFVLLDDGLRRRLDAGVPRGYGCDDGVAGACAAGAERFAETFAKWAIGDIGIDVDLGYAVPPPDDLQAWGRALVTLGR